MVYHGMTGKREPESTPSAVCSQMLIWMGIFSTKLLPPGALKLLMRSNSIAQTTTLCLQYSWLACDIMLKKHLSSRSRRMNFENCFQILRSVASLLNCLMKQHGVNRNAALKYHQKMIRRLRTDPHTHCHPRKLQS